MIFDYVKITQATDSIDIEDTGNTNIVAFTVDGDIMILTTKTICGYTKVTTFGPIDSTSLDFMNSFNFNYFRIEYNPKKLFKVINKFLNNEFITQATEYTQEDFNTFLKNLKFELPLR